MILNNIQIGLLKVLIYLENQYLWQRMKDLKGQKVLVQKINYKVERIHYYLQ